MSEDTIDKIVEAVDTIDFEANEELAMDVVVSAISLTAGIESALAKDEPKPNPTLDVLIQNQKHYYNESFDNKSRPRGIPLDVSNTIIESILNNWGIGNLVGIQPMSAPVGIVYNLQYQYEDGSNIDDEELSSSISGGDGKRVSLNIVSHTVEAGTKKLNESWTIEAMQDLKAFHGIDVEAELCQALGHEIAVEYCNEVVSDLVALAEKTSFTGVTTKKPKFVGSDAISQEAIDPLVMSIAINRAANDIARKTRRGAGNWIVVGTNMLAEMVEGMDFVPYGGTDQHSALPRVGTLNDTIRVFHFDFIESNTVLVGYKGGNGDTDAGYLFCPYIMLMSTGQVINPVTFEPVVSFMTRYGKKAFYPEKEEVVDNVTTITTSPSKYYELITFENIEAETTEHASEVVADLMEVLRG